jgi:hypothetical protein
MVVQGRVNYINALTHQLDLFAFSGKNFVAKHIVESLYRHGYKSKYVRFYVVSRDFMHTDDEHIRQYKV